MVKINNFLTCIFILLCLKSWSQNLISNSSFSDVNTRKDSSRQFLLLPEKQSEVKDWYLPAYINYRKHHLESQFTSLYSYTYYLTSRDKDIFIKNRHYLNTEVLFENNLGFIALFIDNLYPKTVIQQRLPQQLKKGRYCFKFKYKFVNFLSMGNAELEFCFSETNLKEYYHDKLIVPKNKLQIAFKDSINDSDINTPWQQVCYQIELTGIEKYLTIGGLSNLYSDKGKRSNYYIDDLELTYLGENDSCVCEKINKDLRLLNNKEFLIDSVYETDTLIMLRPVNRVAPGIILPDARMYLTDIISFMQRHPEVKITFLEFDNDSNQELRPSYCSAFIRYLKFYGINNSRISSRLNLCSKPDDEYCNMSSEYKKIGFIFHK